MKIETRNTRILLDRDVYDALEARLEPNEKAVDLANQILRAAMGLSEPPTPTSAPLPPKDPEQCA